MGLLQASGIRGARGREWGTTVVRLTRDLGLVPIHPRKVAWGQTERPRPPAQEGGKKIRNDHNTCIVRERGACLRELSTVYRLSE